MRCTRHPYEGGVGVCASCLRHRLLALAVAQNEASSLPPPPPPEPVPPSPSSMSPYVGGRKSDVSGARRHPPGLLFFRTPQVGPACGGGGTGFDEGDIGVQIRRRRSKFSVLSALFGGHPQHHHGSGLKGGDRDRKHRSWLAGIMPRGRRKEEPATASPPSPQRRSCRVIVNRGLSPARCSYEGGEECVSPVDSLWRPSPSALMRKSPCRRLLGGAGAGSGVSGFAVCISPLVRPSPGRHRRGGHAPDIPALCSELRPSPLHHLSSGSSLPHCRSWKLADGGRFR